MSTPASAPLHPGQPGNASSGASAKTRKRRRKRSLRRRWFGWTRALVSRRALLVYTLLGATVAVFGMGGVFPSVYFPAYGLIELALVIGGVRVLAGKTQYHFDPLHVGLIVIWCYGLGEWYFRISPVARLGLTSLMHGGVAIAAFFLFSQVYQQEQDQGWIGAWISLLVLALAVLGLAQWETAPHLIYWHFSYPYAHSFGPFVDRDEFAACMELLLPVSFWQTLRQRGRPDRMLLWGIVPLAGFIAVVVSRSLAGTLVVVCEGALGLGLGWYLQSRRARKPQTDAAKAAEVSRSQRRQARNLRIMLWGLGGWRWRPFRCISPAWGMWAPAFFTWVRIFPARTGCCSTRSRCVCGDSGPGWAGAWEPGGELISTCCRRAPIRITFTPIMTGCNCWTRWGWWAWPVW